MSFSRSKFSQCKATHIFVARAYLFSLYCERQKGGNFAATKKVGWTFCIRAQKRNKIGLWNFDMLLLNNRALKLGKLHSDRSYITCKIMVLRSRSEKRKIVYFAIFGRKLFALKLLQLLSRCFNFLHLWLILSVNSISNIFCIKFWFKYCISNSILKKAYS